MIPADNMKENKLTIVLILLYLFCTVMDSYASEHHGKRYGKVFLVPILEAMLVRQESSEVLLYLALLLCWFGDLLLIHKTSKRNMSGMFCFLFGHILYAILFLLQIENLSWLLAAAGLLLYGGYAFFYFTKIWIHASENLRLPSAVYMIAVLNMSFLAWLGISSSGKGAWITWSGTFLFVISDTLISDQLFRHLPQKGVMETYGPAQLLIVIGFLIG